MVAAAGLAGLLWAALPGVLKAFTGTSELITSLMLNYLAGLLLYYLIYDSSSYWRDLSTPAGKVFPQSKQLDPSAFWPTVLGRWLAVPSGFLIGVALAVALHVTIRHTRFGFQLRVISDSPSTGRYAGMRTKRIFVAVMLISGALAGLAGANEVGTSHLLNATGLQQAQFGYTGIVIAALVRYNPLGVILGAFCLGAITNAGFELQGATFPPGLVGTIEGIMLFCVLGGEALIRYRVTGRRTGWSRPARMEPQAVPVAAGDSTSTGAQ
jgi:simple sugar transport system permease protein